MYDPTISSTTHSAISSPALADGPSHCDAQGGATKIQSGLPVALASLSARQARSSGLMTSGTSGRRSTGLSSSANLQALLENRLARKLLSRGSTLFSLTWKAWTTPSSVSRSRLRASVRRTSEIAITGWATPTTRDYKDGDECSNVSLNALLGRVVWLASRPTPTVGNAMGSQSFEGLSATGQTPDGRKVAVSLNHVAQFSSWPTPKVTDTNGPGNSVNRQGGMALHTAAQLTTSGPARLTVSGELLTGCSAGTKSGGQLNPEHSRWLMGYPAVWAHSIPGHADWLNWQDLMQQVSSVPKPIASKPCADTETQSTSKPPAHSSKPRAKRSTSTTSFDDGADLL